MKTQPSSGFKYSLFISYATRSDHRLAREIERFVEGFHEIEGVDVNPMQVCRDGSAFTTAETIKHRFGRRASLSENPLNPTIIDHLQRSEYLLVLCSRAAVRSDWVNKEILWFYSHRGVSNIRLAVTEGDPSSEPESVFPPAVIEHQLHTYLFRDLRGFRAASADERERYQEELVSIVAELQGTSSGALFPLVNRDRVRRSQQELRRTRRQRLIALFAAGLLLIAAIIAWIQRQSAEQARQSEKEARLDAEQAMTGEKKAREATELALAREDEARQAAEQRADELTIDNARTLLKTNPMGALEALTHLSDNSQFHGQARVLASEPLPIPRRILAGHTAQIARLVYSPDGQTLASGDWHGGLRLWDTQTGESTQLRGHDNKLDHLQFSVDGRRLLSSAQDHNIFLWDVKRGRRLQQIARSEGPMIYVTAISLSNDERRVAWALEHIKEDSEFYVRILDRETGQRWLWKVDNYVNNLVFPHDKNALFAATGKTIEKWNYPNAEGKIFRRFSSGVYILRLSRDGRFLVAVCEKGQVWRHDFVEGDTRQLATEQADENTIYHIDFTEDGRGIRTVNWEGTGETWDLRTGDRNHVFTLRNSVDKVSSWSQSGRHLVFGHNASTADLRSWKSRAKPFSLQRMPDRSTVELRGHKTVDEVKFSPDEREFVSTGGPEGSIWVWDTGQRLPTALVDHEDHIDSFGFSPDGNRLASASFDGTTRIWNLETGESELLIKDRSRHVAWLPDGRLVTAAEELAIWDVRIRERQILWKPDHPGGIPTLAVSSTGDRVAISTFKQQKVKTMEEYWALRRRNDKLLRIWSLSGETAMKIGDFPDAPNMNVVFSENGKWVAWPWSPTVHYIDLRTGTKKGFKIHSGDKTPVTAAFILGDSALATVGEDKTLWITDLSTGENRLLAKDFRYLSRPKIVAAPGGELVAVTGANEIELFELPEGKRRKLVRHAGTVLDFAFSPDGKYAVSGSEDGSALVWHVPTGENALFLHPGSVSSVKFSHDGEKIACVVDSRIYVWELPPSARKPLRSWLQHQIRGADRAR